MLTITARGEFPSANLQSQLTVPVEASVLLRTRDNTAEGGIYKWDTYALLVYQEPGGQGGQGPPNISPLRLINIHTCSTDRRDRSRYYVQPPKMDLLPMPVQ